ncbi:MAG: glycosyltransferase family 87 protein [Candidatus Limnocylindrales bacterium]
MTGWRAIWRSRRARLWFGAAIVAAWLPVVGIGLRNWLDFSAFYTAGALAFTPELTRLSAAVTYQAAHGLPITPWVYPAGLALLYVPFALLPYGLAAPLHLALEAGLLAVAAWLGASLVGLPRRWALIGVFAWAPAAAGVLSGQETALALLLVVLAARTIASGWAGVAIGLLAFKPQLFVPQGGMLLLRGLWRGALVALVIVAGHYLLGVVATGGDWRWPESWLATIGAYTRPDFLANGWQAVSMPAFGTWLEVTTGVPGLAIVGYLVGAIVVVAALPALRRWPVVPALALAASVGLVVSPHAWVYDATLLLPALGVFAAAARERGWPWQDRWLLAVAYGLALAWPLGRFVGFVPVLAVVALAPGVLLGWGPSRRFGVEGPPHAGPSLPGTHD